MRTTSPETLLVLIAFAMCACATGSIPSAAPPDSDAGPSLATLAEFCAARAATECSQAVIRQCGAKDAATCEAARVAVCMQQAPQGTTYQPSQAQACLDAVQASYSAGIITVAGQDAIDSACGPALFSGPGAARSPCTSPYDCNSSMGLSCITPTGQTTAKCLVPNMVPNGGPCPGEADVCTGNFYCDPMSLECAPDATMGQPCSVEYTPCAQGLMCGGVGPFASCAALGAPGAACGTAAACASGLCDKLANQATGNCTEQITLSSLDSLCADFN
jgi:hypothetical protein